jgi:hypothetical protein
MARQQEKMPCGKPKSIWEGDMLVILSTKAME